MINIELIFSRVRGISIESLVILPSFYSNLRNSYYEYLALSDISKENIWLLYKITSSSNNNEISLQ